MSQETIQSQHGRQDKGLPPATLLGDQDFYLFNEGSHRRLYEKLGAHRMRVGGEEGTYFAVWAPNANRVAVIGSFNQWNRESHPLRARGNSGVWEGFIPGVERGALYKYLIHSRFLDYRVEKADPFSLFNEIPPKKASIVWDLDYSWGDGQWLAERGQNIKVNKPISIYEVHLGSWRRHAEGNRSLSYRELAPLLADYIHQTGFTHVEFLPLMDHPFFGSWGYQITGYFAPSGNYGTPQDLMFLIDTLHQNGIGVILDWVPSHFPADEHGLAYFDGTHLYEHADPRQGYHPEWNSYIFNYGRNEVRSFLISNALFWLDKYHADGLRVDAVASMLVPGLLAQATANGFRTNTAAERTSRRSNFCEQLNGAVYESYPDVQTIAEESTAWPMVSRPDYAGGLGFGLKWDMGWMHDTLEYFATDPIYRKYHHDKLTFRMIYAFHENFVLPLSHDEVVYGKGSLLGKMPGDDWQSFANLRALFGYMYAQPGKKLLFMGGEIGQWREWQHDQSLDWHLLEKPEHAGIQKWIGDLNRSYRSEPSLHELDCDPAGFEWIDCRDAESSVVSLLRKARGDDRTVLVICNFTPVPRLNYQVGVPRGGLWRELLNSDAKDYGGSGMGNMGEVEAAPVPAHGRHFSLLLTLPPLSTLFFVSEAGR